MTIDHKIDNNEIDELFKFHKLNSLGQSNAIDIAQSFDYLLKEILYKIPKEGRYTSIFKTKLEEACFYAKKSMATLEENQMTEEEKKV